MADTSSTSGKPPSGGSAPKRSPRTSIEVRGTTTDIVSKLHERLVARFRRDFRASLPGLGVSLLIHVGAAIVFALIALSVHRDQVVNPIELGWAATAAKNEGENAPPVVVNAPSLQDQMRAAARESVRNTVAGTDPNAKPAVQPVDVSRSLTQRPGKQAAGAPDGEFNEDARQAIDRALAWIVRQQLPDGRWKMTGPYSEGAESREADTDSGATALALLALLGDGNTPTQGTHQKSVARGIEWLIGQQKKDGDLFDAEELGRTAHFYAHAQGTIVLCEALALAEANGQLPASSLKTAAEKAVKFLVNAQNPRLGGWKYRALDGDGIGDVSVTGWALMALHSARMAKIDVPQEAFLLASAFLDSAQVDVADGSRYRYRPDEPAQNAQLWSMSAEGLLCRQWLGWPRTLEAFEKGQQFLTSEVNRPVWEEGQRNVYAWYYTAQALHNLGGKPWETWFAQTQGLLIRYQASGAGKTGGSWHPTKPKGAFLEWSEGAGRLYFTVMCVLILETPYRHAPIYESSAAE
jgi:hypothetical protein